MNSIRKIAIVVSHPIQHFCPQYGNLAENNKFILKVFFASQLGLKKYIDVNFNQEISWSNLKLELFDHEFLNGEAVIQSDKNIDAVSLDKSLCFYKPDIIFIYGYFQKLQRRAFKWARNNKIRIAYISDSELRQKRPWWNLFLKYFYLRRFFKYVDYFLTVGEANEFYYQWLGVPKEKFLRMHFPIDINSYHSGWIQRKEFRDIIRKEYNIPDCDLILTVVGKLVSWKNQDHIILALRKLENEGIFLQLFIIGSGEMRQEWEKKCTTLKRSQVHFTGFVKIEELPKYYAATDIYVHPASIEPHSIAISEAIYMGCPVIISNRCGSYGTDDDVQVMRNGFVYNFGDIDELCIQIKKLVLDFELRERFGFISHQLAVRYQEKAHYGILDELFINLNEKKP